MPSGVLADRKKYGLGALVCQRLEHRRRVSRPRTVIERQNDFLILEKVVGLEMLKAEAGSAGGVNFNDARHTERVWIVALGGRAAAAAGAGACAF